jgi:hypothetical protein
VAGSAQQVANQAAQTSSSGNEAFEFATRQLAGELHPGELLPGKLSTDRQHVPAVVRPIDRAVRRAKCIGVPRRLDAMPVFVRRLRFGGNGFSPGKWLSARRKFTRQRRPFRRRGPAIVGRPPAVCPSAPRAVPASLARRPGSSPVPDPSVGHRSETMHLNG